MTIDQAIARIDRLQPNDVDPLVKIDWLQSVDKYVHHNVIAVREGGDKAVEPVYVNVSEGDFPAVSGTTTLLVPPPWDECYVFYLQAQIFYEQREIKKYGSAMQLYNQTMSEFTAHYFHDHRQLSNVRPRFS
jgi:hypothetical protein